MAVPQVMAAWPSKSGASRDLASRRRVRGPGGMLGPSAPLGQNYA